MATVVRALFPDFATTSALPFLQEAIDWGRSLRPEWFQQVYNMKSTDRAHEQFTSYTKFGLFAETGEGSQVTYDTPIQGFDKTLTPLQYSLGFRTSKIAFDDDKTGPIRSLAEGLGQSWTETRNIITADHFNNGFNSAFAGPDGLPLFDTAHLREDGISFRNEMAASADFSVTSFRTAQIDFANFRDGRGKRRQLSPVSIMSAPDNFHNIAEVIRSTDRPDTGNRATNVQQGYFGGAPLNQITNHYLTDADAWFLIAEKAEHGLIMLEREPFNVQTDVEFNTR
ncbi:hypothetical protein LCGC14_2526210, partial [marine sediment metagenome]